MGKPWYVQRDILISETEAGDSYSIATGSPPQKGIITYGLSSNRQRPLAGTAHAAVFNVYRRTKGQILFWTIPILAGYELMSWATERYGQR